MPESAPIVVPGSGAAALAWQEALGPVEFVATEPNTPTEALRDRLSASPCALLDGSRNEVIHEVRRLHRIDPTIQIIIVAPAADHPALTRLLLFTPGIGEVWLRSPEQVNGPLIDEAAEVTRTRRSFRRTRSRLVRSLTELEGSRSQRAVISDAYLAALLDAAPDPILSVDDRGRVLSWNPGAERVLGYSPSEAIGRMLIDLLGSPGKSLAEEIDAPDADPPLRREIRFVRKGGDVGFGELIVAPVEAGGQRVRVVVLHDLTRERVAQREIEAQAAELEAQATELEMTNEELRDRTEALEHAAKARDRFYAAMSHELRTPINAILGFLDLVLTGVYGPLGEKQQQGLTRAQRAARHLHDLVNDVLDLARIEAGRMEIDVEETHLPSVIHEVLDTVRSIADSAGSELTVTGPAAHTIRTDPRRLRQILLNLLSNAIKFGLGKPIEVRWETRDEAGVKIQVVDRGSGIEPEHIERIFEEFSQFGTPEGGGTGLGLSISLRLARLLGGSLEVTSTPGEGSTFELVLPADFPGSTG